MRHYTFKHPETEELIDIQFTRSSVLYIHWERDIIEIVEKNPVYHYNLDCLDRAWTDYLSPRFTADKVIDISNI